MPPLTYPDVAVGDELPTRTQPAISRTTLALFAGASGDHNPIHIDIDFAKKSGMDDVFAQGMLSMAYMASIVTSWAPQSTLRGFSTKFVAITWLQDEITCTGKVVKKSEVDGETRIVVELQAANQSGEVKLVGEAILALPHLPGSDMVL